MNFQNYFSVDHATNKRNYDKTISCSISSSNQMEDFEHVSVHKKQKLEYTASLDNQNKSSVTEKQENGIETNAGNI